MPRSVDPSTLTVGGGTPPPTSIPVDVSTHVIATAAHNAAALHVEDLFDRYGLGMGAEGALQELAALVPPEPGTVGSGGVAWLGSANTGVPDWGILKLRDGALAPSAQPLADVASVYPYYYRAPISPAGTGLDPDTDATFNVADGTYTGGGSGRAHAAWATVSMGGGGADGYPSWRVLAATANPSVVVSGVCYPADRGVLALVKWAAGTAPDPAAATSVSDIQARCIAAILLGKGAATGRCDGEPGGIFVESSGSTRAFATIQVALLPTAGQSFTLDLSALGARPATQVFTAIASGPATLGQFVIGGTTALTATDVARAINALYSPQHVLAVPTTNTVLVTVVVPGTVGNGIALSTATPLTFVLGAASGGTDVAPSPYEVPGRAAGQHDLDEIHRGVSFTSTPAPLPNPAAGQVRLLTDPSAVTFSPGTATGGIPILGGTTFAVGSSAHAYLAVGTGGGTAGNFFAYRLPALKDYSVTTGLHYTPVAERARYTTKLAPASAGPLTRAGDYANFGADWWGHQVARYRHRFALASGGAATRRDGSYALVHFKRELDFERYVRDGVPPTSSQVYSINLVDWTGVTSPHNQIDNLALSTGSVGVPYAVHRSEVAEDSTGTTAPTAATATYTLTRIGSPSTTAYSGVAYYVPRDRTQTNAANLAITALNVELTGVFTTWYRGHDRVPGSGTLSTGKRKYALTMNPVFLSLASYTYEGTESPVAAGVSLGSLGATLFGGSLGEARRQRLEFGFSDLNGGATNPGAVNAVINVATSPSGTVSAGVAFTGDVATPVFTQDARLRVFVRRPLAVDGATGNPLPYLGGNTASNRGFVVPEAGGNVILYHSMRETSSGGETVAYGNPATTSKAVLNSTKDREERFLDEVYRYPESWAPLTGTTQAQLRGPGLPSGVSAIAVPVRPISGDPSYPGFYFQSLHTSPLTSTEAQVAGLPARNPDWVEGLSAPFSSRGLLQYPKTDYSSSYTPPGPDYSTSTGARHYVRVFDAGAANVGSTTVKLVLWGVDLTTFAYAAPGPGSLAMVVSLKVPGLTTWMDAGRADGSGPSKQDALLDGAGCQVVGPNTVSTTDTTTQLRKTQVEVNLGPMAALFLNGEGKCPLAIRITLKDSVSGKALDFTQGGEDGATASCRGLVGIEVLQS